MHCGTANIMLLWPEKAKLQTSHSPTNQHLPKPCRLCDGEVMAFFKLFNTVEIFSKTEKWPLSQAYQELGTRPEALRSSMTVQRERGKYNRIYALMKRAACI